MNIEIRPVKDVAGCHHFQELQRRVWGSEPDDVIPIHVLVTVLKHGGYLLGAYAPDGPQATGAMVGAALWWLGTGMDPAAAAQVGARLKVCSHMLGVLPDWQRRQIGLLLKLAQRETVLAQGLTDWITWTYDPLYRANGVFNLHRLRATCSTYVRDVYGELEDDLNRGAPTDRFQVDWRLNSPHVLQNVVRDESLPPCQPLWSVDDLHLMPLRYVDGYEQPGDVALPQDGRPLAVPIPSDIGAIRRHDRELLIAWRFYLREVIENAFRSGYSVVDCTHIEDHAWSYILIRESL